MRADEHGGCQTAIVTLGKIIVFDRSSIPYGVTSRVVSVPTNFSCAPRGVRGVWVLPKVERRVEILPPFLLAGS